MVLIKDITYEQGRIQRGGGVNRVASHPPFWLFFFLFSCLLYFYFCWNRYCLPEVNIFINAKHKQSQNGSLNYLDFCQSTCQGFRKFVK